MDETAQLTEDERESLTAVVKTWLPVSYAGLIPRLEAWIVERDARRTTPARHLADESFRHSWLTSDEQKIGGVWVQGLCCECGDFVPYGNEVEHVTAAFASLLDALSTPLGATERPGNGDA